MLYDTSLLLQCQVKKYSGLNFARKIRSIAPGVSSKIWYCGTSIGLTYDGLIASANFCRNRFCPTCQWRRSVKLFRQNYDCFNWIKAKYPGCRFIFLTLTVPNVSIDKRCQFNGNNRKVKQRNKRFKAQMGKFLNQCKHTIHPRQKSDGKC